MDPMATSTTNDPKLGLALSGGGHRAAFFHIGVLAKLAEHGLLRRIEVVSTVSGGSIVGALYYLHVKNLLEDKLDGEITDDDYVRLVRDVEREYRRAAATNVRGSGWANLLMNFKMARPTYSRTDRVGELYEQRFYAAAWRGRPLRNGRISMRDLIIQPKGHAGAFDPDTQNSARAARVPVLILEATTLNTGHNWRFEAMYVGEPRRQGTQDEATREDIDKNVILERTRWDDLPSGCRDFPLGAAVAASACFPGGFPPMQVAGLFDDYLVELVDGGVHDNQGIEGVVDRGCTHMVISDGSGQMPDRVRPSIRMPSVLGRVISIYGDAEREQRLLAAPPAPRFRRVHASADGAAGNGTSASRRRGRANRADEDGRVRRPRRRAARAREHPHRSRRLQRSRGVVADGRRLLARGPDRPLACRRGRARNATRTRELAVRRRRERARETEPRP